MQSNAGRRGVLAGAVTLLAFSLAVVASLPAHADRRHAALVLDANTGRVLHADSADQPRYPASLTKMMTLYLVFELMEAGKLNEDTRIRISAQASAVAPSKLDLDPGDTITLGAAIRALVTKSANDVAVAIAEHIAGNEPAFARAMTAKARQLGMRSTVFRNAHGLPDSEQVTTARNMVTLSLALYDHFPRHSRVFSTRRFTYAGKSYRNHNTMLGSFAGMEGIKTGYTRASGFNLATSVRQNGRHVVAVVLGGRTAAARNAEMRNLLTRAMARASTTRSRRPILLARTEPAQQTRGTAVAQASKGNPRLVEPIQPAARPESDPPIHLARVRPVSVVAARADASKTPAQRPWQSGFGQPVETASTAPAPQAYALPEAGRGARPSTLEAQARRLAGGSPAIFASHEAAPPAHLGATARPLPTHARPTPRGDYAVQVGAFASEAEAIARLREIRQAASRALSAAADHTEPVTQGSRTLYRARFADLPAGSAAEACNVLRRQRVDCFVTRFR